VTIIPEQRDSNNNADRNFEAALWGAIAEAEGMPAWHSSSPVSPIWWTGIATVDLARALDLGCEADGAYIEAEVSRDRAAADEAGARSRALWELCDFLEAVVAAQAGAQA
jgi:hypothetical protein